MKEDKYTHDLFMRRQTQNTMQFDLLFIIHLFTTTQCINYLISIELLKLANDAL